MLGANNAVRGGAAGSAGLSTWLAATALSPVGGNHSPPRKEASGRWH